MILNLIVSGVAGLITYAVVYAAGFQSLLSKQPGTAVSPDQITSYPSTAAWIVAVPAAIFVAIVVFAILYFVRK